MKKTNTRGFSHLELFVVILVFVAIGALGTFGYQRFKSDSSSNAEAGSMRIIRRFQYDNTRIITYSACKTNRRATILATSYTVRVVVGSTVRWKNNTSQNEFGSRILTSGGQRLAQKYSNKWWNGNLQSYEYPNTRGSRVLQVHSSSQNQIRVADLPNC